MNLDRQPTLEDLRQLIRGCDDSAGHHVLWVARNGDVSVARLPKGVTPAAFQQTTPGMQLRCETFEAGNEYVGPEAAEDDEWMNELFGILTRKWAAAKGKPTVEYIGQF